MIINSLRNYRSASLNYLWGMINVLQIIVHMPLFTIAFPTSSKMFFSILISVSQFDVLPSELLDQIFFNFDEAEPYSFEFSELDIF